jgi:hypothetical protein
MSAFIKTGPECATFIVSLCDRSLELLHPFEWESDLSLLFGPSTKFRAEHCTQIQITAEGNGRFGIREAGVPLLESLDRQDLLLHLSGIVIGRLAAQIGSGISLHGGAVGWNGRSILIPGASGAGKSSLTAWFVDKGFDYLTDELAVLLNDGHRLAGLPRALMLKPEADAIVSSFPEFAGCAKQRYGPVLMLRPQHEKSPSRNHVQCGLIVFPDFNPGAELAITSLSAAKASMRLMAASGNASILADGGVPAINRLVRDVPAFVLTYGAFEQLEGVLDVLAKFVLDKGIPAVHARRIAAAFKGATAQSSEPRRYPIPTATPRVRDAKLTIGMSTYDDYDGVYFSLQALRLYHPEIIDETEFIVIDNHPDGPSAEALKALDSHVSNYRYIPEPTRSGTAVRGRVFAEAAGDFVLCMDCHVLIAPGAVSRLLQYFRENPKTPDLLQGPLVRDDLQTISTHLRSEWRAGMYGVWDNNGLAADPDAQPFEIPMQGLGVFACRKEAWLGFNEAFRGFGGEEGYIHEKFRRAGARTLCLPFLRWLHRFNRPMGVPYRNVWEDRVWNYLIGFTELGLPTIEMEKHFREHIGEPRGSELIESVRQHLRNFGYCG